MNQVKYIGMAVVLLCSGMAAAQTWTPVATSTTQNLLDLAFVNSSTGWMVGAGGAVNGMILRTINGGSSFSTQSTGFFNDNKAISAINGGTAWIADGSARVRKTENGGSTWATQLTNATNPIQNVAFLNSSTGWAVGDSGRIWKTVNGGTNWTLQASGTASQLTEIFAVNGNVAFAAGVGSTFVRTTDGGTSWQAATLPLTGVYAGAPILDLFFVNANEGWAPLGQAVNAILKTTDGGVSWTTNLYPGGSIISSVWFTDASNGWGAGTFGGIYRTVNGGLTWSVHTDVGDAFLNSIQFVDANTGWVCGTSGGVWKCTAVNPDSDGDGIPDAWESANGLNPSVSNAPTANADGDWMTDIEEYWADTQPTNGSSFFPKVLLTNGPPGTITVLVNPASTARVYGVYANTNLLQVPQAWTLVPPEQTGTASALTLTITNTLPAANYRTGVRLP